MRKRVISVVLILTILLILPVRAIAQEGGGASLDLDYVMRVVVEALDKINVDKLMQENSTVSEKYKFSDEDVAQLKEATRSFTGSISDYAKAYMAAAPDKNLPAPHDGLKDYCSRLQAFLEKYNVTCEDVLMKFGDIKKLGDNISSQLKISPGAILDKETDKEADKKK